MTAAPTVRLADGDSASGLAAMIGDLVADNVRDFKGRRRVASRTRGEVALRAADRDVAITLSFGDGEVVIAEGVTDEAPVLSGPWLTMAQMCSGQLSPVKALATKQLHVSDMHNPARIAAVGFVLSVPESFYEPELVAQRRRRALLWTLAATVVVVAGAFAVNRYVKARR